MESLADVKSVYQAIGTIESPALCGNTVSFSNIGFNHLLYKKRRLRPTQERVKRFGLLKCAKDIIESKKATVFYREMSSRGATVHFWAFNSTIDGNRIRVIVSQIDNERMQFLSIMKDDKNQKDSG